LARSLLSLQGARVLIDQLEALGLSFCWSNVGSIPQMDREISWVDTAQELFQKFRAL